MTSPISRTSGASIKDVAALAGVSAQTVSRVANDSPGVRDNTRQRVLAAMRHLDYSPNKAARALRHGTFSTIGMMAHGFHRTGEALILKSVLSAAGAQGYSVTLIDVPQADNRDWVKAANSVGPGVDGLIVVRTDRVSPKTVELPTRVPIALSDSSFASQHPVVVSDQIQGVTDAVELLLNLGHRNVHFITGPSDSEAARVRADAWRRSLEVAGLRPPKPWRGDWTAEVGYQVGRQIAQDSEVTAVCCANDEVAFGLMRALHEAGKRVPEDVSVIGFDDILLSQYAPVPLTTVRQDFDRIGQELVRLVLTQLRGEELGDSARTVLPTELVVRSTTAAPPPR